MVTLAVYLMCFYIQSKCFQPFNIFYIALEAKVCIVGPLSTADKTYQIHEKNHIFVVEFYPFDNVNNIPNDIDTVIPQTNINSIKACNAFNDDLPPPRPQLQRFNSNFNPKRIDNNIINTPKFNNHIHNHTQPNIPRPSEPTATECNCCITQCTQPTNVKSICICIQYLKI